MFKSCSKKGFYIEPSIFEKGSGSKLRDLDAREKKKNIFLMIIKYFIL